MKKDELVKIIAEQVKPIMLLLEYDRGFAQRVLNWAKQGNINLGDEQGNMDGQTINRAAQYMSLVPDYQELFGNKKAEEIATTQDGLRVMDYIIEKDPKPIPVPPERKDDFEQLVRAAYGGKPGTLGYTVSKFMNSVINSLDIEDSSTPGKMAASFDAINDDPQVQQAIAQDPKAEKAAQAVDQVAKDPKKLDRLSKADKQAALKKAMPKPLESAEALAAAAEDVLRRHLKVMRTKKGEDLFREELRVLYLQRVFNVLIQIMRDGNVSTACNKANAEKGGVTSASAAVEKGREKRAAAANRKDRAMIEKVVRESLKRLKVKK